MKFGNFFIQLSKKEPQNEWKTVNFYFCIATQKLILEPNYLFAKGSFYWHVKEFEISQGEEIYEFCKNSMAQMNKNRQENCTERLDLVKYFNVKTYSGMVKKIESFQFCWTDWQGFYFAKGERNRDGFTYFIDTKYEKFDALPYEEFLTGYSKCVKRILKKLERREMKKLKNTGEPV